MHPFSLGLCPSIDYNYHWASFHKAYFYKNLFKSLIAIDFLKVNSFIEVGRFKNILDVGCGAAVATIAWLASMGSNNSMHILIDSNSYQLMLAQETVSIFSSNSFILEKYQFPTEFRPFPGLRFYSYWFCEQQDLDFLINGSFKNIVGEAAIIIDYPHIINKLRQMGGESYNISSWKLIVEKSQELPKYDKDDNWNLNFAYIEPSRIS